MTRVATVRVPIRGRRRGSTARDREAHIQRTHRPTGEATGIGFRNFTFRVVVVVVVVVVRQVHLVFQIGRRTVRRRVRARSRAGFRPGPRAVLVFHRLLQRGRFHGVEQQLLRGASHLALLVFSNAPTRGGGASFQSGGRPIEDHHRRDAVVQQAADATEESNEVRVREHVPALVTHRLDELHQPDARVHRDSFTAQGFYVDSPTRGLEQAP